MVRLGHVIGIRYREWRIAPRERGTDDLFKRRGKGHSQNRADLARTKMGP